MRRLIVILALVLTPVLEAQVPINWTFTYNYAHNPTWNRFTQVNYGTPAVNAITSGQRRVEIVCPTGNDSAVFLTSDVPALDATLGITAEMLVNVSGPEKADAGIEATFREFQVAMQIRPNAVQVYCPGNASPDNSVDLVIPTASNAADILWRLTVDNTRNLRVYRAAVLIAGPIAIPDNPRAFQRFLWWAEQGATAVFKTMQFYQGGAVAP